MSISESSSLSTKIKEEWDVPGIYLKHVESDLIDPNWVPEGISPEDMARRNILIQQQKGVIGKIRDMFNGNRRKKQ